MKKLEEAYFFVRDVAAAGDNVIFVSTKKQAQEAVKGRSRALRQFYHERPVGWAAC